jgi:hypothetical protein
LRYAMILAVPAGLGDFKSLKLLRVARLEYALGSG